MTTPRITGELRFSPAPEELDRNHRKFLNKAHRAAAAYHHEKHIWRHFDPQAYARYGYENRSRKYTERKFRLFGHRLPNVFTGATRRQALTQRQITATPSSARLILRLAFHSGRVLDTKALSRLGRARLTYRQIQGQEKVLARIAEMETVTPEEILAIAKVIEQNYGQLADAAGRPRVVTFK